MRQLAEPIDRKQLERARLRPRHVSRLAQVVRIAYEEGIAGSQMHRASVRSILILVIAALIVGSTEILSFTANPIWSVAFYRFLPWPD